jgi:Cu(I)/Ag(I) efflux system membrane protein CusA/SilA
MEEGSVMRVRPLLMTVFTTFFGLLPLMFSTGTGAQVMQRLATPMVGGLFSAALLTLVVLPAAYLLVNRRKLRTAWQDETPSSESDAEEDDGHREERSPEETNV